MSNKNTSLLNRIYVVLLFIIVLTVTSSCSNNNWPSCDRDYYDHEFGAYINGQECHDREGTFFNFNPINGGLCAYTCNNSTGFYVRGGRPSGIFTRRGNTSYGLIIEMYIDSTKYDSATRYFFSDTTFSDWELYNKFKNKEIVSEPILTGELVGQVKGEYNSTVYSIKEGWLLLGDNNCIYAPPSDFESVYCYHCARFEFIAESDSGEVLNITDGYCKYIVY